MMKFHTIFWDMDGTILDFLYSQRIAISKVFLEQVGRPITDVEVSLYSDINDSYWKKLELGQITKPELNIARFQTFFAQIGISEMDAKKFAESYQEALGSVFSYIEDSYEVIRSLQGKVKQYIVTNGDAPTQYRKIKLSGLEQLVDGVFVSDTVGFAKPDSRFFDYCFDHIENADKSGILLVGDSLTSDIKGGVLAGIPTCWYAAEDACNHTAYKETYRITHIHDVYSILEDKHGEEIGTEG